MKLVGERRLHAIGNIYIRLHESHQNESAITAGSLY